MSVKSVSPPPSARLTYRFSLPKRYFIECSAAAVLALIGVSMLIAHQYRDTVKEWSNRLSSIADGEELFVRTWVYERNGDLAVLANRPRIASALLPASPRKPYLEDVPIRPLLDKVVESYGYSAIYLVDENGKTRANSSGAPELPPLLVQEAQSCTDVTFKALPKALVNSLNARIALISAVHDAVMRGDFRPGAGSRIGSLIILTKAELIYTLPSLGTASTRTGESILIRRDGNEAVFLSSLRHQGDIPYERQDSLRPSSFAREAVLPGRTGFTQFADYRGVAVFGVSRIIPEVGWGLITKIDRREALSSFYSLASLELTCSLIVLGITGAIIFNLWRYRQVQGLQEEILLRERAEEELRLSHEQLALALRAGESGTFDWDLRTNRFVWSAEIESVYGFAPGKFGCDAKDWEKLVLPEDLPIAGAATEESFKTGEYVSEWRIRRHSDGEIRWILAQGKVIFDDAGNPVRMIGLNSDVTTRKQMEQDLRLSQEQFSNAFEYAPIGIGLVSPAGRWLEVNKALCDLLGYTTAEMLQKTFQEITHPDDLQADLRYVGQMLSGEIRSYRMEKRYFHKSGRVVWIALSVSLVRDKNGRPLHFISQVEDITARKHTDEELRRINRALVTLSNGNQALMRATTESELLHEICRVIVRDGGYRMAWVGFAENDSDKSVRIAAADGADGGYLKELRITWGDTLTGRGPTGRAIRTGRAAVCRDALTDPDFAPWRDDAVKRGFRSSAALPLLIDGATIGVLTIYADEVDSFNSEELKLLAALADNLSYGITALRVSQQKQRAEDALKQAQDSLHKSQKMEALGQLAGGVAHDFNNLLGVIMGYTDLLEKDISAEASSMQRITAIRKSAERAAALTSQLLAFSRRQVLQPRVQSLNALVTDTEAILRRLIGEDIEIVVSLDPELGNVRVDPSQIVQVIINLAVNARDAMPDGGKITIETANVRTADEIRRPGPSLPRGDYVMFSLADIGTGMDEVTMSHVFEPFFTTKPLGKGTGLGLATVFGIVQQSGGTIFLDSELGKGSTFRIYLPRVTQAPEEVLLQITPAAPVRASETVLLVEDEEPMREMLIEHMEACGYRVIFAANGGNALTIAEQYAGQIDLLVTDVIMPQMSGPALVGSLLKTRPGMKVMYMTGYTADKLGDSTLLESEAGVIEKPFSLDEFDRRVRSILNQSAVKTTTLPRC